MSDSIEELTKQYRENVLEEQSKSVGLFTIPEYPELERRGMWSTAVDVLLTTLRYLAPATLLTIFWGQQSFLFQFLKYIDSTFRALVFSNEELKESVLEWLVEAGPVRVDDLGVVWRHGWILCGVLDAALPGACAGHPPTSLSLKHAQSIADHYLGVEPVFTRHELELRDSPSRLQKWKLVNYLDNIRQALYKVSPSAAKSCGHKASPETQFTLNYIARGSGLTAAQLNHKVHFKIYPTAQQSIDPGDINILIHGPKNTYGMTVLPPILGKAQLIRQNLLGLNTNYTESILPITQGTTYLRNYGSNNINKTFYIPKTKYDIDIDTEIMQDHAKISYVANLEGKYEISITSRGQNVVGSPFTVTCSTNIVGILEKDTFCLEDGEEIDIVDVKTDKKVVLRIVDFVSEKMLLRENGSLEKITEEQAKYLIENDAAKNSNAEFIAKEKQKECLVVESKNKSRKFYYVAQKVLKLNRVCKLLLNKRKAAYIDKISVENKHVPDVVNSTFGEVVTEIMKTITVPEKRDRIIVPENISVSILTEKSKLQEGDTKPIETPRIEIDESCLDYNYNTIPRIDLFEDDNVSVNTVQSTNNPFLTDMYDQTFAIAKQFGSFVPNEYESNNSQNEETENANMKLFDETQSERTNEGVNPFLEIERPKTPVYKIITGEVAGRDDCVYIDTENQISSLCQISDSDYKNPFVDQGLSKPQQDKPDFIIGAPVSLPPLINMASSTPNSKINITAAKKSSSMKNITNENSNDHKIIFQSTERKTSSSSNNSNLYNSLDSNLTEDVIITPNSSPTPSNVSHLHSSREMSPRKDTWDSAYVSIDDNNSSEGNISDISSEILNKRKSQISNEFSKMGPAEKEMWQNEYSDLKYNKNVDEDLKSHKFEIKRPEITPIIEESEKSTISGMKDITSKKVMLTDPVTEAFADLNDMYDDFFSNSEVSSVTTTHENQSQNLGIDYTVESNKTHVDSASECKADVKRQTKILEGKISEIQAKVTESVSASRNLHVRESVCHAEVNNNRNDTQLQFGDQTYTNIVLEKKKYWDEKIRLIEAKSEEIKSQQCKRRITSKHLRRNDSLSKRRGKKILQNFLRPSQEDCDKYIMSPISALKNPESQNDIEVIERGIICKGDENITNKNEPTTCFGRVTKNAEHSFIDTLKHLKVSNDVDTSANNDDQKPHPNLHLKQELSEKVFQAFETSPKRFFGTSRKHILNKIDTFLGLPDNEKEKKKIDDVNHESGLVSSRISLFHTISHTEELPWARRKSKSMYNITRHDSDKCIYTNNKTEGSKDSIDSIQTENSTTTNMDLSQANQLKEKRARITHKIYNKSFDETTYVPPKTIYSQYNIRSDYVKNTIKGLNEQDLAESSSSKSKLKSISKSEMDIFNKVTATAVEDDLDKHKSFEELPKVSVKNFITLYEDVSKSRKNNQARNVVRSNSVVSPNKPLISSSIKGTAKNMSVSVIEIPSFVESSSKNNNDADINRRRKTLSKDKSFEIFSNDSASSSFDFEVISNQDKDPNYLSCSDIEIEIIDKDTEKEDEPVPEAETAHLEYKNRFTMAKQFFQSLEELRVQKKTKKLSKKESFMSSQSIESLEENTTKPRRRSNIKKSKSMPSSEIAKIWDQMQEEEKTADSKKLVKISEKFNVDDLFEDVMEGRLSRQGSLRGIPHKKAVLETFRSMENVADPKLNSYEMAVSQLSDFAHENKIKNAQTYLSEYPYLPTTDPSKYHSRLDANASGLITLKELKKRPRRNSVPDLRLNPTFTADL